MTEPAETRLKRLKRLKMRSMRRGTKEMDIILNRFWDAEGADLSPADLDLYEALLNENDQDIYRWVSEQQDPPGKYLSLIARLRK